MSDVFDNKIEPQQNIDTDIDVALEQSQPKSADDKFTNDVQVQFDENFNIQSQPTLNIEAHKQTDKAEKQKKKGIGGLLKGNKEANEQEFVEPEFKVKKKGIGSYIKWVVIGIVVIFIVSKFIQAKKNPTNTQDNTGQTLSTETNSTEIQIQDNYSVYIQLLAQGKCDIVDGFDFSNKDTYPTQTGAKVKYTDIVKTESIINQTSFTNLTKSGKKELLNDVIMYGKALSETDKLSDEYIDKLINDISALSFIDTVTFNTILEENGKMVELDTTNSSKYEAEIKIYDSVNKIYDENGSKCIIVGAFCTVDDNKIVTLTLLMEEEGNVLKIPVKVLQEAKLERDNKLDNINNGFTQFAYSTKIENLELDKKYIVQAITMSDDKTYKEIGSIVVNER